jgi:GMP synthase (glutamine-hydrolysing)
MAVVVLQHVAVEGPGRIAGALERAGRDWRVVHLQDREPAPSDPHGLDGLVVMGGPMGVGDVADHPHLADERTLIRGCLDAEVPVLGVCLGAQLLAAALGAPVRAGESIELGWHDVTLTADGRHDPVLGRLPRRFAPLHWHGDVFDLPPGATALGWSEQTPVQAFRHGRAAYGLLFHLEVHQAQVAAMAEEFPDDVRASGIGAEHLVDASRLDTIAQPADDVFDAWVALLS